MLSKITSQLVVLPKLHSPMRFASSTLKWNTGMAIALVLFAMFFSASPAHAQLGNVTGVSQNGDTVTLTCGADQEIIQVCQPDLIKVDYRPGGYADPDTQVMGNTSWGQPSATFNTNGNPITITTSNLMLKIATTPCRLSLYNSSNVLLLQEPAAGGFYPSNSSSGSGVNFTYANSGAKFYGIFGYGAYDAAGGLLLANRGGAINMGEQGECGAPFVWSNLGFGLLIDTGGGQFNIGSGSLNLAGCTKANVECYLIVDSPTQIIQREMDISGHTPMFPKWAMGFANSQWGCNEGEILNVMTTYRQKHEPIDTYIIDFDWKKWGQTNGEWTWNPGNFPDGPSGVFCQAIASEGFKMVGINKPRVHVNLPEGQFVSSNGWWFPNDPPFTDYFDGQLVDDLDFLIPAARNWWAQNLMQDAFSTGVSGWWNDEGDGDTIYLGNFEYLNWDQGIYEAQRTITNQRVFQLNRDFFLGGQRYAYGMWSGDIAGDWGSIAAQRDHMLQAINLGERLWGQDTGGFTSHATDEGYARWMEFSAFVPIFRVHGDQYNLRQPWIFGTNAEAAATKAMRLRYSLIPYIYSYERNGYDYGTGLVHPLVWDYPSDTNVFNDTAAWMFGNWLLISPVVSQGATSQSVYLPPGTWIDYFRGSSYTGGSTISYSVNSSSWQDIPLFVKLGAIIPTQPNMDFVGQIPVAVLAVDIFPSTTASSFRYYDDDGTTYAYENGISFAQTISQQQQTGQVSVTISAPAGSYVPALECYRFAVHGIAANAVTSSGGALTPYATPAALAVATGEGWATGTDIYGNVTFVRIYAQSAKNLVLTGSVAFGSGNPPAAPANVTASADNAQVNVNWTDDFGAQSYNVYRATSVNSTYEKIASGVTITSYVDTGLSNGTTYYYEITAVGAFGEGAQSGYASAAPITVTKYEAESASLSGGASVASNQANYSGSGFVAGIVSVGTAVTFTVSVGVTGEYQVGLRYANSIGGPDPNDCFSRTMTIYVNGTRISQINLPPLETWDMWTTLSEVLSLSSGSNTITYSFDQNDTGNVNIDYITVSRSTVAFPAEAPYNGVPMTAPGIAVTAVNQTSLATAASPWSLPGTVQAENYDTGGQNVGYYDTDAGNNGGSYRNDDVDIEATTDTGGGYDVGWTAAGEWLKYTVNVQIAGAYNVGFRVASGASGGSFHLLDQNGNNLSGRITVPGTGGWQNWITVNATATLSAGVQTLRLYEDTDGYNLNYMTFTPLSTPATPPTPTAQYVSRNMVLSWPSSTSAFTLWSTTNLTSPIDWLAVTNTVTTSNGQSMVTIGLTGPCRFFRLVAP
jgi:alpha-glucosidase (family GH31 glycosyl hydrolase)